MPVIPALTTFTANTKAKSSEVNSNFSTLRSTLNTYGLFADVPATISAAYTFSVAPTLSLGATITSGGLTVSAGGLTVTGNSTIAGTLGGLTGLTVASGGASITGNSTVTGNLSVTGTVTGGTITVPAAGVTAGTFGSGNYVFPGNVTATSGTVTGQTVLASGGQLRGARATQTGAGGTVNFSTANHVRHTMTGNGTITLSGGSAGGVYTVEVLQDGSGGRTVAWSGAVWPGGVAPTSTTTANRKDVFTFYFDGTNYLGVQFGANFASTA